MDKKEVIEFANANPVCYLATIENNRPHVRAMLMWYADKSGFYFETLSPKEMSKQLHLNRHVEVCFYNNPDDVLDAKELRISGEIEFIEDPAVIDKALENRAYLEDLAGQPIRKYMEVFRIAHGNAHFWNLKTDVLKEHRLMHLAF
ncbi:pyridoxamine 5'-phosphate oxidase family protein [Plebeiibacterium marinum]|uniref:Pyridoxamine 5'-phosphate oxidase family protein n=1 Tax=Plebeiibacterium marinum TaxID=2992111 RepID=A0AAE3MHD3_9BACT|nr:pyridoxamine 5'-phosphate oxidase family protein [Plebeiobacterium marinum]MCW3807636.1 pyridoxamine 5'-phosphate oxidase family protein [Plebeiobacterium marinum]